MRAAHHLVLAGAVTLAGSGAAAALAADAPSSVVVTDGRDARPGAPDLKRVAASRTADHGVRLAVSLDRALAPEDLLAEAGSAGPPGSVCVRLWTTSTPRTTPPDLLACVTAVPDASAFRATVTREVGGELPATAGTARLTRPSRTSVVLRLPGATLGSARRVSFAAEATRPGCPRLSCVDLAPDRGETRSLRLR